MMCRIARKEVLSAGCDARCCVDFEVSEMLEMQVAALGAAAESGAVLGRLLLHDCLLPARRYSHPGPAAGGGLLRVLDARSMH